MTKRVLVTGANGYIGTHVVQELLARGFEAVACVSVLSEGADGPGFSLYFCYDSG